MAPQAASDQSPNTGGLGPSSNRKIPCGQRSVTFAAPVSWTSTDSDAGASRLCGAWTGLVMGGCIVGAGMAGAATASRFIDRIPSRVSSDTV